MKIIAEHIIVPLFVCIEAKDCIFIFPHFSLVAKHVLFIKRNDDVVFAQNWRYHHYDESHQLNTKFLKKVLYFRVLAWSGHEIVGTFTTLLWNILCDYRSRVVFNIDIFPHNARV